MILLFSVKQMLNEDEVLFFLKEYLLNKGWEILSYKSPGGHGGIPIKINHKRSIVLDMIAFKSNFIICIEAKPKYSNSDREKLDFLFSNAYIFQQLKNICEVEINKKNLSIIDNVIFIKTLAYSFGYETLSEFIIFKIIGVDNIKYFIGKEVPIEVSNYL
jgi:hypothetical protein